jgi:LacI family transcriptional regulator
LRDIAATLGLSVNSVSRALAGKDSIGEETRARVHAEARRLGYVPNSLARSLVTGATMTLGFVLTNPSNPVYAELITTVEQRARQRGYSLLLATSQDAQDTEVKAVELLLQGRVDGVLMVPVQQASEHLARLPRAGIPLVLINRDLPELGVDFVGSDELRGAYEATDHLIRLGHRRIGLVVEDIPISTMRSRIGGFHQAMADAGLAVAPEEVHMIPSGRVSSGSPLWSPAEAYETARRIAASPDRPTALFVANDLFALGIYRGLAEAGLRIPEDMALVGYSDFFFANYLVPPLTTVHLPIEDVGATALELLLERVSGTSTSNEPKKVLLRPSLIVRDSCGSGSRERG